MTIVLYDLAGRDDRRFSPNCWRTRMAIAHKGLDCEARATRFTEIAGCADGRQRTIPAIEDGGRVVGDSAAIARHLEAAYPDRPSLFGGPAGAALTGFVEAWAGTAVNPVLIRLILADIYARLDPADRAYFRESREKRFGMPLEQVQAGREERLPAFRQALEPARQVLAAAPFLGGAGPLYADYVLFGSLQWARVMSPLALLAEDDPVKSWFERCLDLHGGLGRAEPACA